MTEAHSPVLTTNWNAKRQATTYKVAVVGTSKFLLFTAETLRDLQRQINEALKGIHDTDRRA